MKRPASYLAAFAIVCLFMALATGIATPQTSYVSTPQLMDGPDSVSGWVYDANHNAIPGAEVTLYFTQFIPPSTYNPMVAVNIADNPQQTSNGSKSPVGYYRFNGLQPDNVYAVTAEINGIAYTGDVQVISTMNYLNVTIPNYTYSPTPVPTPEGPTYQQPPGWVNTPVAVDSGGIDLGAVLWIFLLCMVAAQLVVSMAVLLLIAQRKS